MNVTVFGATSGVVSRVVDQLRAGGHTVTAYVRGRRAESPQAKAAARG